MKTTFPLSTAPPTTASHLARRSFGEVLSTNTATTDVATSHGTAVAASASAAVPGASFKGATTLLDTDAEPTEPSSVAQLRSRLNQWGQKNQKQSFPTTTSLRHTTPSSTASSASTTSSTIAAIAAIATVSSSEGVDVPPRRPKVRPSVCDEPLPTLLPPAAAHALAKRMAPPATSSFSASSSSSTPYHGHPSVRFDAVAAPHATTSHKPSGASFRARSTPVRIRVPVISATESNVQATNEGYASVAELSRWLADDPTSTKKTLRHLRRGANIIAKSRKFDKVLANIVIVEDTIPRDCVSKRKEKLLQLSQQPTQTASMSIPAMEHRQDDQDDDMSVQSMSQLPSTQKDWMMLGTTSSASVADKKKWLSSAFPTSKATTGPTSSLNSQSLPQQPPLFSSTQSDIGLSASSDLGHRAKDQWRRNHRSPKPSKPSRSSMSISTLYNRTSLLSRASTDSSDTMSTKADLDDARSDIEIKLELGAVTDMDPQPARMVGDAETSVASLIGCVVETEHEIDAAQSTQEQGSPNGVPVDFRLARQMLVQRSKANGNDVEVMSAVKRRTAKFEMLEKDTRLKSNGQGLLKPAWEGTQQGYVKKYRGDVAPKKALSELP